MAEYNQHPSRTIAPKAVIREIDESAYSDSVIHPSPVSLVFGFAPNGPLLHNYCFSDPARFMSTFGSNGAAELSTAEKYFINACVNVMNQGGSVIPIRLPYDNEQANTVKYFRYQLSDIYGLSDLNRNTSGEHEVLKQLYSIDSTLTHYRKIKPASMDQNGNYIVEHMTTDEYNDFILDPYESGIGNSIYFFDNRAEQLRTASTIKDADGNEIELLGICPVIVSASTALYYQEKIKNSPTLDTIFNPLSIPVSSTNTYSTFIDKNCIAIDKGMIWKTPAKRNFLENEEFEQATMRNILNSFSTTLDFHHQGNYYDKHSVGDICASYFPVIRYVDREKLERKYLNAIGVIVLRMVYNTGTEKVDFMVEESFVGNVVSGLKNGLNAISTEINNKSSYIHCALTTYVDNTTDFYHVNNSPLVIMGMRANQCQKYIHYKKSIVEPIQYMFETDLSDVDSLNIDMIVDAGLTTVAHYAYHYWKQRSDMKLGVDIANSSLTEFGFSTESDEHNKTAKLTTYNIGTLDEVLRKLAKGVKSNPDDEGELIPGNMTNSYWFSYNGSPVELTDVLNTAANSIYSDTTTQCPNCEGTGLVIAGQPCPVCDGSGLIRESDGFDDSTGISRQSFGGFYFDPNNDKAVSYNLDESVVEECSTAWLNIVKLVTSFIESRRGDCIFLVDGPRCLNLIRDYPLATFVKLSNNELFNSYLKYFTGITSSYAARYYNWIYGVDISTSTGLWFPATVFVGAIYTRSEKDTFPWFSPAGFERGVIPNAYGVSIKTKSYGDENDVLYKNNWNFMRQHINVGIVVEGQKTLQMKPTALDRVNVRRLCNYLKQQIRKISNHYKYEPNTAMLREQYRNDLSAMLQDVQMNAGISDFIVKCDDSINTDETINRNELHAKIWFKPVKAVEFIFIDLTVTKQNIGLQEQALSTPKYY